MRVCFRQTTTWEVGVCGASSPIVSLHGWLIRLGHVHEPLKSPKLDFPTTPKVITVTDSLPGNDLVLASSPVNNGVPTPRLTLKIVSSLLVAQPNTRLGIAKIVAVEQVRRMRRGSQAHLMRCSDQNYYVVKFRNNPQHRRVLAKEMLASVLARIAGLPVPEPVVVEVTDALLQHTPQLNIQTATGIIRCESGLQFGSRYAVSPLEGQAFDHVPAPILRRVRNMETFAGMLALDKWTCNSDGRQAAFWRTMRQHNYAVSFIDQGNCFNGGEWNFPDAPLGGVYEQSEVYANVVGWDSFEPWLSRIEDMGRNAISAVADEIPPGWYGANSDALDALVRLLLERRTLIRGLVTAFRSSSRHPFPNWGRGLQSGPAVVA